MTSSNPIQSFAWAKAIASRTSSLRLPKGQSAVRPADLEEDMNVRRQELRRPNPNHVENRLTVVKSIFKYAHDIGYIPRNPAAAVLRTSQRKTPGLQGFHGRYWARTSDPASANRLVWVLRG
jgi:hypothetical protein